MIPINQRCQSFDPFMTLPQKMNSVDTSALQTTVSCYAPAYVYIEGDHGKKFLCDFHYEYEKVMVVSRHPEDWPGIVSKFIDEREKIKETFDKTKTKRTILNKKCWCKGEAFVEISPITKQTRSSFFCNFHYRKLYYRHLSNKQPIENTHLINDERVFMEKTIVEEAESLIVV
jgi:hypothetical protein